MKASWKTTLCGIVGVFCLGASETPGLPVWAGHLLKLIAGATPAVGLMFARDNNVTSEQAGAHEKKDGE